MFLSQAAQAPIQFGYKDLKIAAPKFETEDWIKWADEIDSNRKVEATEGLTPEARFRLLVTYNILPTDIDELRNWVGTPRGSQRIVRVCLQRSKIVGKQDKNGETQPIEPPEPITVEIIKDILKYALQIDLILLAKLLADIHDVSKPTPQQTKQMEESQKKEQQSQDPTVSSPTGEAITLDKEGEDPLSQGPGSALQI